MQFGIWLPSYTYRNRTGDHARRLRRYIERVEEAGLDIWVIDHLLTAEGLYGTSWLEPMTVLTYAAGLTERARLGTGILVLPLRNPVLLAKEIASLDYVSRGRFIFGVGPGWYPPEFEATGGHIRERGGRTDEMLEAVRRLLSEERVSFEGRFYRFRDVTIEPFSGRMPPVWVSGGSRLPDPEYHDRPEMVRSVLERIVRADAWLSRASGNQDLVKRDWELVRAEVLRRRGTLDGFLFAHCNFIHVVDTRDRKRALDEQEPVFRQVMGTHRSFDWLQQCYLLGTPQDQLERLRDLERAGCRYVVLGPTTDAPDQLQLLLERIIDPLRSHWPQTPGG